MTTRLLDYKEVCTRCAFGKSFLWDAIKKGTFPRPLRIGRSVRWREDEIEQFIEERTKARNLEQAA